MKPFVGMSMKIYSNDFENSKKYANDLKQISMEINEVELVYLPSIGLLHSLANLEEFNELIFGAQNIGLEANGAHTGEFSLEVVDKFENVQYVELGHAERLSLYNETFDIVSQKLNLTLDRGYKAILCIGENQKFDNEEDMVDFFSDYIDSILKNVQKEDIKNIVFAYEPIWAIGKAEAADPSYVHNSHKILNNVISNKFGENINKDIRIIYGGSVSKTNVSALLDSVYVNGVFVGRFGHEADNLLEIVKEVKRKKWKK